MLKEKNWPEEELTATIRVNRERMYQNAMLNKGLDNSECVMMRIAEKLGKDRAHELLYNRAMKLEFEGEDCGMGWKDALRRDHRE